jgi:hypothetical protein
LLYHAVGEGGLRLIAGVLVSATFGLLMWTASLDGARARSIAISTLLATLLAASNLTVRSQLLAYPLFVLTYLALQLRHRRPELLYLLPPLFMLWGNLHGSFALGLVLIGLYAAGDLLSAVGARLNGGRSHSYWQRQNWLRWSLLLVACAGVVCLNPIGARVYVYVLTLMSNPIVKLVEEWRPTTIQEPTGLVLAVSLVALVFVLRRSRRPVSPLEPLLLVTFGGLALSSQRNVIWWGLVLAPILARHAGVEVLPAWRARRLDDSTSAAPARAPLNLAMALLLIAFAVGAPVWRPLLAEQLLGGRPSLAAAPEAAVDFVARLPAGSRLYQHQPWTGYVAWRLWPAQQPFVDVRIEAHPVSVWLDYFAVSLGRADWQEILDSYQVDYLLLQPRDEAYLIGLAASSGQWLELYDDGEAVVLGRRKSEE